MLGNEPRLAAVERELLLVELLKPQLELLFELVAALLLFLEAKPRRVG